MERLFFAKTRKNLKEKYGIFHTIHTVFTFVILFVPFILFLAIAPSNAFEPTTEIGNVCGAIGGILGLIGSCWIDIGLVNIFMALIKQYLGHWVTLIALVGGVILDALGLFMFTFVN